MNKQTNINTVFTRHLLKAVHQDVKNFSSELNLHKDAWVYHYHNDHWEFHGPGGFYWYGHAGDAFEARYKGWSSWLRDRGVLGYANKEV